ncbi:hypothetical protein JAAARDRAFT_38656 [Jaapia argillacea MUCL 33604]|uniref:Phosphoglycerate mutase-like protein n=1 Tax=Jaapia argillacea MUCL 33604 TaxID=933084 RepID=A0A067PRX8_9AGAM|nr:hypothetical protein JAAARDRAFT_38656 [Jaapia argillacea MUCL 33604]
MSNPTATHTRDYDDKEYNSHPDSDLEQQSLLPQHPRSNNDDDITPTTATSTKSWLSNLRFSPLHLTVSFVGGIIGGVLAQHLICTAFPSSHPPSTYHDSYDNYAPPHAGSSEVHNFPPPTPTNIFPSLFPTQVGYAGITPTGAEAALVATAPSYPIHTGAPALVVPASHFGEKAKDGHGGKHNGTGKGDKGKFDLFKHWGNLSPWYSVGRGTFGLDSGPEAPDGCRVTGLHFLHRHGARYPTSYASYGGPANFTNRLNKAASGWTASGDLEFMNDWTYKLGEEVLTPFGRQQLFDLGVSMRLKYGFLLKNFTESNTIPVFRTESQDRMLSSALNFAIGFFGYPFEGMYQQSITIEADGFNNTLAPYKTCPNTQFKSKADRGRYYVAKWANVYLQGATERLGGMLEGFELSVEDVYSMQQMCAYETVAIGYSKFCELFTEEEWEGFNYAMDLYFWYDSAFGSPVARIQGIGYVQELLARLTHTKIPVHNSSTNATLDDSDITFPLGQSLYVDATHEVVVLNVITALNLTNFARDGPLPATHIPPNRSFRVSELAPFATNVQFQLLSCTSHPTPQIRIIINDGVVPLTGIRNCPKQKDGMCPLETFVESQKEIVGETDWRWGCFGEWEVPEGEEWETVVGYPPAPGS